MTWLTSDVSCSSHPVTMVGTLSCVFVLSHAFRRMIAVASDPVASEFGAVTEAHGAIYNMPTSAQPIRPK